MAPESNSNSIAPIPNNCRRHLFFPVSFLSCLFYSMVHTDAFSPTVLIKWKRSDHTESSCQTGQTGMGLPMCSMFSRRGGMTKLIEHKETVVQADILTGKGFSQVLDSVVPDGTSLTVHGQRETSAKVIINKRTRVKIAGIFARIYKPAARNHPCDMAPCADLLGRFEFYRQESVGRHAFSVSLLNGTSEFGSRILQQMVQSAPEEVC